LFLNTPVPPVFVRPCFQGSVEKNENHFCYLIWWVVSRIAQFRQFPEDPLQKDLGNQAFATPFGLLIAGAGTPARRCVHAIRKHPIDDPLLARGIVWQIFPLATPLYLD
jgi:hypothetical protein